LEVHYHLGKANVIMDVLSRKAHYNYLPVVRLTGEESSTRVIPDLSLFNITVTPTLRDEITAAQKNDEGMDHIKRMMQKGPYGSRKGWLCQGEKLSRRRFWMKPIHRGTPFIL
jgi:hypothetical protein